MISSACGVDFGTSNSTVGWSRPGQHALLSLEDGKPTLPSAIFFHDEDNEVSYGRGAIADYLAGYDGRLMRSMKSLLGSSLIELHRGQGRSIPFRVLLTRFIAELKRRAETAAGRDFQRVVLGRPVFFVDDDPAADQTAQDTLGEIARQVGFTDIEFQFEPLAAAFDYESQIDREELVLVIDIGGGTSDFSLIRLGPGRAGKADRREDILAYGGVHIGARGLRQAAEPGPRHAAAGPGQPAAQRRTCRPRSTAIWPAGTPSTRRIPARPPSTSPTSAPRPATAPRSTCC